MKLKRGIHRVLAVSDLQCPFEHRDALAFVEAVKEHYGTTTTVVIGDEVDFHALSPRFFHDPDGSGPGQELALAIDHLQGWYSLLQGQGLVRVCTSNHTGRIFKKAFQAGIPRAFLRKVGEFLQAPDEWVWADSWVVDSVKYEHGDAQGGMYAARQLALTNRQSTVIGHHHSHGGVNFIANNNDLIFGLNTGCLIDRSAYVFDYGKHSQFKPTLGCGVIIEGAPSFVPMVVNKRERWIGDLIV